MRLLVVSDVHGNAVALRTVLEKIPRYDEVVVLGDLVDYGPDPDEALDIVKSGAFKVVMGNHDFAAAFNEDCRCGPSTKDLSILTRKSITLRKLSKNDLAYLASLPRKLELTIDARKLVCVHATLRDNLFQYLYPWSSPADFKREILEYVGEQTVVFVGHTHHQFLRSQRSVWIANPGSVGQPRDGDPRAAAAILSEDGVLFLRIRYDIDKVIEKLRNELGDTNAFRRLATILRQGMVA